MDIYLTDSLSAMQRIIFHKLSIEIQLIMTKMIFQIPFYFLPSLLCLFTSIPWTIASPYPQELTRRAPCDGQVCGTACCDFFLQCADASKSLCCFSEQVEVDGICCEPGQSNIGGQCCNAGESNCGGTCCPGE
jgi:hypothetical protein